MNDNFLEHYGTKGMKWGVRKDASAQSRLTKVASARNVKSFSDADLKAKVNRLNMEKQYTTLTKENANTVGKGGQYVGNLVKSTADYAVQRSTKGVVNMVVDKYVTPGNIGAVWKKIGGG